MRKINWWPIAIGGAVLCAAPFATAADHLDSPAAKADPSADITDVYTWVDGNDVVLVLNVAPLAATGAKFSNEVQYALHTESTDQFGMPGKALDVICTFDVSQKIQCWLGDQDYVTGDASAPAGITSTGGKFKVFAGLRDDPFFFNLEGFKDTVATVDSVESMLAFDPAGCPTVDGSTSNTLVGMLKGTAKGTGPAKDFFAGANVLSIVISADKSVLTSSGKLLSVWGSTNKAGG